MCNVYDTCNHTQRLAKWLCRVVVMIVMIVMIVMVVMIDMVISVSENEGVVQSCTCDVQCSEK